MHCLGLLLSFCFVINVPSLCITSPSFTCSLNDNNPQLHYVYCYTFSAMTRRRRCEPDPELRLAREDRQRHMRDTSEVMRRAVARRGMVFEVADPEEEEEEAVYFPSNPLEEDQRLREERRAWQARAAAAVIPANHHNTGSSRISYSTTEPPTAAGPSRAATSPRILLDTAPCPTSPSGLCPRDRPTSAPARHFHPAPVRARSTLANFTIFDDSSNTCDSSCPPPAPARPSQPAGSGRRAPSPPTHVLSEVARGKQRAQPEDEERAMMREIISLFANHNRQPPPV